MSSVGYLVAFYHKILNLLILYIITTNPQILMINSFLDTNSVVWVVLGLAVFVVSILITMWFFQRKRSQKVKKRAAKSERLKAARSMARKQEYAIIPIAANNETPSDKSRNPHEPLAEAEQV